MEDLPAPRTKSSSAYERLKQLVISGRLRPNYKISPAEFADSLRLSITPVREALFRLEIEGFVRREVNRGYFVKAFDVREQGHLYDWLIMGTMICLFEVVREDPQLIKRTAEKLDLEVVQADADGGGEPAEAFVDAHDRVLIEVLSAVENESLARGAIRALEQTRYVRVLDAETPQRREETARRLRLICAAVIEDDVSAALHHVARLKKSFEPGLPALVAAANARVEAQPDL